MSLLILKLPFQCANSPAFRTTGYEVSGKYLPLGTSSFLHTQAPTSKQTKEVFSYLDSSTSEELKPLSKRLLLEGYFAPKKFSESLRGKWPEF